MKKIYLVLSFLYIFSLAGAQQYSRDDEFKTIFGGKTIGGYGGIGIGYTLIDDRPGLSFDGRAGAVLGKSFALGVAGAGFMNSAQDYEALNERIALSGGYGGVFAEYILFPRWPVHLSFPVVGGLGAMTAASLTATQSDGTQQNNIKTTMVFMIVEPGVELEFTFTRFFRMAGYFSYRFTTGTDMIFQNVELASPDALVNYNAGLRFKFGRY